MIEVRPLIDWNDLEQVARFADPLAKVTGFLTVMGIPHRVVTNGAAPAPVPATASAVAEEISAALKAPPPPKKAAAKAKAVNPTPAPAPDLMPDLDPLPEPFPDDAPAPEAALERTDEEKKHRALALLRHVYTSPGGGADAVKKLQKAHKVAKFADVSLDDANMLLVEAEKLARDFNVVLPQVLSP